MIRSRAGQPTLGAPPAMDPRRSPPITLWQAGQPTPPTRPSAGRTAVHMPFPGQRDPQGFWGPRPSECSGCRRRRSWRRRRRWRHLQSTLRPHRPTQHAGRGRRPIARRAAADERSQSCRPVRPGPAGAESQCARAQRSERIGGASGRWPARQTQRWSANRRPCRRSDASSRANAWLGGSPMIQALSRARKSSA